MRSRFSRSLKSRWRKLNDRWGLHLTGLLSSKIVRQTAASLMILAIIVIVGSTDTAVSYWFGDKVFYVVNDEYDLTSALRAIRGSDTIRSVFSLQTLQRFWGTSGQFTGPVEEPQMEWPVTGSVSSEFGWRKESPDSQTEVLHQGIDIEAPEGTGVVAAGAGVVEKVEESLTYGKVVEIRHDPRTTTVYAHCLEITVDIGQRVQKGDVIAKVGKTGNATAPHLHFEVKRDGKQVDPLPYLK